MLLPLFQALKIQAEPTHFFARYQWLDPTNRHLQAGLEHGYQVSAQHQPHLALVDFTHLPPVSIADELWLSMNWFPRVVKLPFRQVAIVSRAEHRHNQTVMEAMFWVARHLIRFQIQLFDDVPSALEWLLPTQLVAAQVLQAEWDNAPVSVALAADA